MTAPTEPTGAREDAGAILARLEAADDFCTINPVGCPGHGSEPRDWCLFCKLATAKAEAVMFAEKVLDTRLQRDEALSALATARQERDALLAPHDCSDGAGCDQPLMHAETPEALRYRARHWKMRAISAEGNVNPVQAKNAEFRARINALEHVLATDRLGAQSDGVILRARIAELEREGKDAKAVIRGLRENLRMYGAHKYRCYMNEYDNCTCGLSEALATPPADGGA